MIYRYPYVIAALMGASLIAMQQEERQFPVITIDIVNQTSIPVELFCPETREIVEREHREVYLKTLTPTIIAQGTTHTVHINGQPQEREFYLAHYPYIYIRPTGDTAMRYDVENATGTHMQCIIIDDTFFHPASCVLQIKPVTKFETDYDILIPVFAIKIVNEEPTELHGKLTREELGVYIRETMKSEKQKRESIETIVLPPQSGKIIKISGHMKRHPDVPDKKLPTESVFPHLQITTVDGIDYTSSWYSVVTRIQFIGHITIKDKKVTVYDHANQVIDVLPLMNQKEWHNDFLKHDDWTLYF